jgi:hypothetical protein
MSSFSVFDSKGGEVVGPKTSPTHNNTKLKFLNFKWYHDTSGSIQLVSIMQVVWLWEDQRERTLFGNGLRKGGMWIMELGGGLSPYYYTGTCARAR